MISYVIKCPCMQGRNFFSNKKSAIVCLVSLLIIFMSGFAIASSDAEYEPKGWVTTDTYRVMNFVVLAAALFLLLRKPVSQGLGSRIKGIEDELNELETRKKAAEAELARYSDKLAELDGETEKIIAEYIRQGNEAKARILKEAESAAVKLETQARRGIENEFEKARNNLKEEILEKAFVKAENIIKSKITAKDQNSLIGEYLKKVVA